MTIRPLLLTVAAAAAVAGLAAGSISAQAPAAAAKSQPPAAAAKKPAATPTRTADGHPDFTGTYDVATMTPVERPSGVTKLVLTKEEAAVLEQYEMQR